MAKLTEGEINEALAGLPGWSFDGESIRKEFLFKGFKSAIAFIVRIAFEAEFFDDLTAHRLFGGLAEVDAAAGETPVGLAADDL